MSKPSNKKERKSGGKSPAISIEIRQDFKDMPRRYTMDGQVFGIGGPITIPAQPPSKPRARVIREATVDEYLKLADNPAFAKIITVANVSTTNDNSEDSKGPEGDKGDV